MIRWAFYLFLNVLKFSNNQTWLAFLAALWWGGQQHGNEGRTTPSFFPQTSDSLMWRSCRLPVIVNTTSGLSFLGSLKILEQFQVKSSSFWWDKSCEVNEDFPNTNLRHPSSHNINLISGEKLSKSPTESIDGEARRKGRVLYYFSIWMLEQIKLRKSE